jgi:hypothetical protein
VGGFSPGAPVSSTNKTDYHDKAEILLKVVLNTITLTHPCKQILVGTIFFSSPCLNVGVLSSLVNVPPLTYIYVINPLMLLCYTTKSQSILKFLLLF